MGQPGHSCLVACGLLNGQIWQCGGARYRPHSSRLVGPIHAGVSLSGLTKQRDWGTTVALSRTGTKSRCGALRRLRSRTRLVSWFCRCCWCWAWLGGFAAQGLVVVNAVAVIARSDASAACVLVLGARRAGHFWRRPLVAERLAGVAQAGTQPMMARYN